MAVEKGEKGVEAPPEEPRPRETRAAKIVSALEALLFSSGSPIKRKELAGFAFHGGSIGTYLLITQPPCRTV